MALHVLPIIMAGGSSTRPWPFSRALYPKQLSELYELLRGRLA